MDTDPYACVPLGEFAAERSAAGNVVVDTSAHTFADFGKDETVGNRPRNAEWTFAGESLGEMVLSYLKRPAEYLLLETARCSALSR